MKKTTLAFLTAAAITLGLAAPSRAEEPANPWYVSAETSVSSRYGFRGLQFSEGNVFQGSVTACKGDKARPGENEEPVNRREACGTVWGNYDLEVNEDPLNEVNYVIEGTQEFANGAAITAGFNHLVFPGIGPSTNEVYLTGSKGAFGFEFGKDIKEGKGWTANVSGTKEIGGLEVTATVGHNDNYWLFDEQGETTTGNYGSLGFAKALAFNESITITPSLTCQTGDDPFADYCFGGVSFGFE